MKIQKLSYTGFSLVLSIVILLAINFQASAQGVMRLVIDQVMDSGHPRIESLVSVYDEQGYVLQDLSPANFSISEEGQQNGNLDVVPVYDHPLQIVLLIDTTQSMSNGPKPAPIDSVIASAKSFVASLSSQDEIAVIFFGESVTVAQDLTYDKSLASAALDKWQLSSTGALYKGLEKAAEILEGRSNRPVVLLFTDGVDGTTEAVRKQRNMENAFQALLSGSIVVYPVGWNSVNKSELNELATITRGKMIHLSETYPIEQTIQTAFEQIQSYLPNNRLQFHLTFSSNTPSDGKQHQFNIRLEHLGEVVEQSAAFVTPLGEIIVSLVGLSDGQPVGGNVLLAPKIFSPSKIEKVEFLIDGQPLASQSNPPYEYIWNTTTMPEGDITLTTRVTDVLGNTGQSGLNLHLRPPVKVTITNPQGGTSVSGSVGITAEVDSLAKVARVEFLLDGKPLSTVEHTPYEYQWNTFGLNEGGHDIQVRAVDVNDFDAQDSIRLSVGGVGSNSSGSSVMAIVIAAAAGSLVILAAIGIRSRKKRSMGTGQTSPDKQGGGKRGSIRRSATPIIIEREGLSPGQEHALLAGDTRLGRKHDDNDIILKGASASRNHAIIRFQDGHYQLYNLRIENPILINGQPMGQQHMLQNGDKIQAGESVFEFQA